MNRLFRMVFFNFFRVPGLYWKLCRYAKHPDKYPEMERWNHISHILQCAIKKSNVTLQVTGKENIPQENGYMMYANHQGLFDVVAIAADFPGPLACVLKKELVGLPLIKQIVACTKSFPMDREDVRQSLTVIKAVSEEVKAGRNYIIFPEGTRSKNGNVMGEFHGGSFKAAMKAKCPILPMAFVDSFKALDQKGSKPLTVQMHYLPVIPYEEYKDMTSVEIAQLMKDRIQQAIDQGLSEQKGV